jgi:hypothetical protein
MERRGDRLGWKPEAFRERRRRSDRVASYHHFALLLQDADDDTARAYRMRVRRAGVQHTRCEHGAQRKSSNTLYRFEPKGGG